jgi:hypothetical protein
MGGPISPKLNFYKRVDALLRIVGLRKGDSAWAATRRKELCELGAESYELGASDYCPLKTRNDTKSGSKKPDFLTAKSIRRGTKVFFKT